MQERVRLIRFFAVRTSYSGPVARSHGCGSSARGRPSEASDRLAIGRAIPSRGRSFRRSGGPYPDAINVPYARNLTSEGKFLPLPELEAHVEASLDARSVEDVIVHCRSGVTAFHTSLAFAITGRAVPKLYVGSFSEYARADARSSKGPIRYERGESAGLHFALEDHRPMASALDTARIG